LRQQRKNIEGSLFLIKRRTQPRFQMLVLNKLSTGVCVVPPQHQRACAMQPAMLAARAIVAARVARQSINTLVHVLCGADNYTEPIHGGLELETNPPYLMYTHGDEEVGGG
jgi:hypothetical protein